MSATPARHRYNRSVLLLSVAYALVLFGTVGFFRSHPGTRDLSAYVIATLPALPIVGVFVVLGRYFLEERDEYLRLLMTRQALVATGVTLTVATIWGFVEDAGLAPHVPAFYAAVLWFAGLGAGRCVNLLIERRAA